MARLAAGGAETCRHTRVSLSSGAMPADPACLAAVRAWLRTFRRSELFELIIVALLIINTKFSIYYSTAVYCVMSPPAAMVAKVRARSLVPCNLIPPPVPAGYPPTCSQVILIDNLPRYGS